MEEQLGESVFSFPVVCAWCGSEIRRDENWSDSERDARGMCQACFRRMVEEHARLASRPPALETYASER